MDTVILLAFIIFAWFSIPIVVGYWKIRINLWKKEKKKEIRSIFGDHEKEVKQ